VKQTPCALAQGILDQQYTQLTSIQDDSEPTFLREVYELYFEDAWKKLGKLGAMLAAPNTCRRDVDALVHQLKGSSSSVGLCALAGLCKRFREVSEGKEDGTDANMKELMLLNDQLQEAYSAAKDPIMQLLNLEEEDRAPIERGREGAGEAGTSNAEPSAVELGEEQPTTADQQRIRKTAPAGAAADEAAVRGGEGNVGEQPAAKRTRLSSEL